jgi:superfamily II DNA or RNA helicase
MVKPFKYQEEAINEILNKFQTKQRVLYQLSTGGGKTFVFCFLAKKYVEIFNHKVLILCHRQELIDQTIKSMTRIGLTCEELTSKTKKLNHTSNCYVAMVETAHNRLKKNEYFFENVGLIIADECHTLVFDKVFSYFPFSNILGCTATPVVLKRITYFKCKICGTNHEKNEMCCNFETTERTKPYPLSNIYEDIVVGPKITDLIEMERLVQEISFVKKYAKLDNLKTDNSGEYTNQSLDKAYSTDESLFNVVKNYQELCRGKKTIIFNNSTTTNRLVYEKFLNAGYNVRMYDSINSKGECRNELVNWFKNERDAILCNVSIFTTGFDVTDIEAIILNRATTSLSLFLQMVGRGVRVTDVIYKDNCILIDGGENIDRFQEFSDPTRDWKKIFFEGIGKDKPKKEDAEDVLFCDNCGDLIKKSDIECPHCGFIKEQKTKIKTISDEILIPIIKLPPPNGKKIIKYTISQGKDSNFAIRILIKQILELFQFYGVTRDLYYKTKTNGKLYEKVKELVDSCYFDIIFNKEIQSNNNRTKSYIENKVLNQLESKYEI